jgi:hypothetical protein
VPIVQQQAGGAGLVADKRAYFRLDVGYLANPKVAELAEDYPRAVLLHLQCIAYATQHATNGIVPVRLAMRQACAEQCDIDLLLQCGLLVRVDDRNVEVHDYLEHQRSADEVKSASDKGKKAAEARWAKEQDDARSIAPSMPDAMPRENREKDSSTRKRAKPKTDLPEDWTPNAKHIEKARGLGLDVAFLAEQFANHHAARGNQFVDWDRAFFTWIGNAPTFGAGRPQLRAVVNDGRPEGW